MTEVFGPHQKLSSNCRTRPFSKPPPSFTFAVQTTTTSTSALLLPLRQVSSSACSSRAPAGTFPRSIKYTPVFYVDSYPGLDKHHLQHARRRHLSSYVSLFLAGGGGQKSAAHGTRVCREMKGVFCCCWFSLYPNFALLLPPDLGHRLCLVSRAIEH
jgi:hypothetical protein